IKSIKRGSGGSSIPVELKFPIDFLNKEWATFVGGILSEGYLYKDGSCQFWNTNKELMEEFLKITNKCTRFNNKIRIYEKQHNKDAYYINYPAIIGKILINGLNMKPGKKPIMNSGIPSLYLDLTPNKKNYKITASLLRWIFAGDGWSVFCKDKKFNLKHRNIGLGFARNFQESEELIVKNILNNKNSMKKHAPKLLKDCGFLLYKHFDIKMKGPYLNKKKPFIFFHNGKKLISVRWLGFIYSRNNLKKFEKFIGFPKACRKTNEKLKNGLKSFENIEFDHGETLYKTLKLCSDMGIITKHDVIKTTNLCSKWIENILTRARKNEFLIISGGGKFLGNCGREPYIYNITSKGMNFLRDKERLWGWDF
ncbi:MAG: hypothetical protein ISS36_00560, partial [Candidatus Aenigmarchaeota archaeon]|nr:hypothetical protein [Candidatus Aenigmarchaeota archaeon]